jgi:putative phage-type endonuclease
MELQQVENLLVEQRSDEWFNMRKGKITSSEIHKIIGQEGKLSETAKTYLLEKVTETLGGAKASAVGAALDWGTDLEPVAIAYYEETYKQTVTKASFAPYNEYYGGSPDGHIAPDGIIEVKCPFNSSNHFKHGLITSAEEFKKAKPEYYWQCVSNMLVTNTQWCDFISFDPRVAPEYRTFVFRLHRDEEDDAIILARLDLAVEYMQKLKVILQSRII